MLNLLLDILFPKKCVGCRKNDTYFCEGCILSILQTDLFCPRCENKSIGGLTHPHCEETFGLDGLWSLGIYQGPLKRIIQKLKYEPSLAQDFAPILADILINYWQKFQPYIWQEVTKGKAWTIIPVPLHWYKQNKRGFNQSDLIGKLLAKKLNLDYCTGLKRIHYTGSQVKLKRQQRKDNIKNAFSLNTKYHIQNTNVLLIDDVWTTGATLKECCLVLKQAGAKKVWAITIAC